MRNPMDGPPINTEYRSASGAPRQPQATQPMQFQVTLLVQVECASEEHGIKIVEGGVSTALNVEVKAKDVDLVSY